MFRLNWESELTTKHYSALLGSSVEIGTDKRLQTYVDRTETKTRNVHEWRSHNKLHYTVRHILTGDLTKQSQIYNNTGFIMRCNSSIVTGPNTGQVTIDIYISISICIVFIYINISYKIRT